MPPTPPKLPHPSEIEKARRPSIAKNYDEEKLEEAIDKNVFKGPPTTFSRKGSGLHSRTVDDIAKGHHRPHSPNPNLSPKTTRRVGSGSGRGSSAADETGFDGVKESEGDKGGKSDGDGKGETSSKGAKKGFFDHGMGIPQKLKDHHSKK